MDDRRQQFLFSNEPERDNAPEDSADVSGSAKAARDKPKPGSPQEPRKPKKPKKSKELKKPSGPKESDKPTSRRERPRGRKSSARREPDADVVPPAASREAILGGLTAAQREAVEHLDGPMLVLAGAGSGKTRVITRRVARLIQRGVPARSILSITFTNKAAGEMKERVRQLVGDSRAWVSTFHAFCARLLREDIERLKGPGGVAAYKRGFVIYAEDDSRQTIADAMKEVGAPEDLRPAAARSTVSRWKSSLVGPDEARATAMKGRAKDRVVADVYRVYERMLREREALDFDDLLLKTLEVLRLDAAAREKWNRRYRYVQVDEYQDTNRIQYEIVRHLAGPERNVTIVGDPDQSIYSWRGAEPGNIEEFLRDFEGARVVRLDTNFRSRQPILDASSALISRNSGPRAGELKSSRGAGRLPRIIVNQDDYGEAREIARRMSRLISGGRPPREIAVFYRTNAQSRAFEQAMLERGVPYVVVGTVSFYQRREVKDAIAYLRVALNRADDVGFRRIVNTPRRGVGPKALAKLAEAAAERGVPIGECVRDPDARSRLSKKAANQLTRLDALLGRLAKLAKGAAGEAARAAVEESGLRTMYENAQDFERVENVDEFVNAAFGYDEKHPGSGLAGFLEEASLLADIDRWDRESNRAALMTLHAAKGLEFPVVFVAGVEDGLLPHGRSLGEGDQTALEEERRLLYVGMTRAMDELTLSYAHARRQGGQTRLCVRSRFLDNIPSKFTELEDLTGDATAWESSARPGVRRTFRGGHAARPSGASASSRRKVPDEDSVKVQRAIRREIEAMEDSGLPSIEIGMRLRHPTFGVGRVVSVRGSGRGAKLTIDFPNVGRKLVALGFVELRPA